MVDCRKKIYKETDECIKKREENKLKKIKKFLTFYQVEKLLAYFNLKVPA